ncbi:MAG TPA: non-homologous end-joining DNA ligase, partial [Legionellaceae bacterium]|nr:non-homologous end-joining DNA ligase [Legionellaceae bacterium]
VSLTHPDKILYSEEKITKAQIYDYYTKIAPYLLPYIINRPLSLVRCPNTYHECFYQKHLHSGDFPDLCTVEIQHQTTSNTDAYVYLKNINGLQALAQMGVLEIHPWGSTIQALEKPDILIFDIDPAPRIRWRTIVNTAFELKQYLEQYGVMSFVKSTGGKGLHVVVPIQPMHHWHEISIFCKQIVDAIAARMPNKYVTTMSKEKRKGKIFLDYLRNQRGATAIAPFSLRARIHAPVATPLDWQELQQASSPLIFTIFTIHERLKQLKKDPWEDFWQMKQKIDLNWTF